MDDEWSDNEWLPETPWEVHDVQVVLEGYEFFNELNLAQTQPDETKVGKAMLWGLAFVVGVGFLWLLSENIEAQ